MFQQFFLISIGKCPMMVFLQTRKRIRFYLLWLFFNNFFVDPEPLCPQTIVTKWNWNSMLKLCFSLYLLWITTSINSIVKITKITFTKYSVSWRWKFASGKNFLLPVIFLYKYIISTSSFGQKRCAYYGKSAYLGKKVLTLGMFIQITGYLFSRNPPLPK